MKKTAAAMVTAVMALTLLAGCGGDDPYCAAVKEHQSVLDSFGKKRTNSGFRTYSEAVHAITATAPDTIKDDWAKLGNVTDGVIKAHKSVGITLQGMNDPAKLQKLSSDDLEKLNHAYEKFNDTAAQRTAIDKDVKSVCSITLK